MRPSLVLRHAAWRLGLVVLATATVVLAGAGRASAATLSVCRSGCQFTTIPEALAAASDGDTITIGAGTYNGGLDIDKSVSLIGAGPSATTIDGGGTLPEGGSPFAPVVIIRRGATVTISGVTISGGRSNDSAGGIFSRGTLRLENTTVSGNTASGVILPGTHGFAFGGGIENAGGTMTLENSTVTGNTAIGIIGGLGQGFVTGGGIENVGGTLTLIHSTVSGNTATAFASNAGSFAVAQSGGIENIGATLTLIDSTVSGNTASATANGDGATALARGGAIENTNFSTLIVIDSTISGNTVSATVNGNGGDALARGGAIENRGTLTLEDSTVSSNTADASAHGSGASALAVGGGIFTIFPGTLTLIDSTVTGNTPDDCVGC